MRDGELCCRLQWATYPPGQGSAVTPTARKGKKALVISSCMQAVSLSRRLHSCETGYGSDLHRLMAREAPTRKRVFFAADACARRWRGRTPPRRRPFKARGVAVPTPCRPVQTGGGRRVTPSSTQFASRPLRCMTGLVVVRRGSRRPPLHVLRWSFARRHRRGHW